MNKNRTIAIAIAKPTTCRACQNYAKTRLVGRIKKYYDSPNGLGYYMEVIAALKQKAPRTANSQGWA